MIRLASFSDYASAGFACSLLQANDFHPEDLSPAAGMLGIYRGYSSYDVLVPENEADKARILFKKSGLGKYLAASQLRQGRGFPRLAIDN
jgi:hypothetical protein